MAAALAVAGVACALAAVPIASSADSSLGQLNSELGQQQAHQQQLQSSLGGLSQMISSLSSQIALVQSREAAVQAELAQDRVQLAATQAALTRERELLARLRARLARGRMLLTRQLVSNYESGNPDLLTVLLESNGFKDLLDRITFLRDAEAQQQAIITFTRRAKARATTAAQQLGALEATDEQITVDAALRVKALAGMNSLLQSKQGALQQAQAVQRAALAASQARSGQIQAQISAIEAQQAAQQAAEQQAALQQQQQQQAAAGGGGPAVGGGGINSGSWVIPSSIVNCESGGQNLPPNSAGASGYYQIMPGTWRMYGGSGSSAYGASRAEQNQVASKIWAGGSGASNWVCAGMVGIH
ncbi:MAG TPA: transglycosylase family protein [Solirubrobacteraceae bacterium]